MTGGIFDRIGTLTERLQNRLGRPFGACHTCGKPTRSHLVAGAVQCHACFRDGKNVVMADGGRDGGEHPPEGECPHDHDNPLCDCFVTNAGRARKFRERMDYLEEHGVDVGRLRFFRKEQGDKFPEVVELGQGAIKDPLPESRAYEYTADEVEAALRQGADGFVLYFGREDYGTENLLGFDVDTPEYVPYDDLPEMPTGVSGSGRGNHHLALNAGDVSNAKLKVDAEEAEADIQAHNKELVMPGSIHESGGIYHDTDLDTPLPELSEDDLPESLQPGISATWDGDDSETIPMEPPEDLADALYTTEDGITLSEARRRSDYLDKLLSYLDHPNWGNDTSVGDFRAAKQLAFWKFSKRDAMNIIRRERSREKVHDRVDDYLRRTVEKAYHEQDTYYDSRRRDEGDGEPFRPQYLTDLPDPETDPLKTQWRDRRHEDDGLTKQEVYDRVYDEIDAAQSNGETALIDAMMSTGKTYNTLKRCAVEGEPITYLCPRHDTMDQAEEMCLRLGIEPDRIYRAPSAPRDCPTFQGEHGAGWKDEVDKRYALGAKPSTLHERLDLPCQGEDHECEYVAQNVDDVEPYDVVIGHYRHAYLPHFTAGRNVVLDEYDRDAMWTQMDDHLETWANSWCERHEDFPYDHFSGIWEDSRRETERKEAALEWFEQHPPERDEEGAMSVSYHAHTAEAIYTILAGTPVDDKFSRAFIPGSDRRKGVFFEGDGWNDKQVTIQTPPDLNYASSVLALDGTPEPAAWKLLLGRSVRPRRVLSDAERREFLRDIQGIVGIQASQHAKPYSSGNYVSPQKDAALIKSVAEKFDRDPVVFGPQKALDEYRKEGVPEKAGVKEMDNFANLRGTNRYKDEELAVVAGSSNYGDKWVKTLAAMNGEAVEPEGRGMDRDYGVGNKYLRLMREAVVGQTALRVGRGDKGAVVVINTAAVPDWFPMVGEASVTKFWTGTQMDIAVAMQDIDQRGEEITTRAVADHPRVDCTQRNVRKVFKTFAKLGYITIEKPGQGLAMVAYDDGLHRVDERGQVEVTAADDEALAAALDRPADGSERRRNVTIMPAFRGRGDSIVSTTADERDLYIAQEVEDGEVVKLREPGG